jgi:4-hydroxy-3-methylbut-2-enyl diphosphate reductase
MLETDGKALIYLASPRGFCAGVSRAISAVENAVKEYTYFGSTIFVRRQIVHNNAVIRDLTEKGVIFIDELEDIAKFESKGKPTVVFAAHGVAPEVYEKAKQLDLRIIDATCPLVERVHKKARKCVEEGDNILLIGDREHDEIQGTIGAIKAAGGNVQVIEGVEDLETLQVEEPCRWLTQTTLSRSEMLEITEAAKEKFPFLRTAGCHDICYATTNRQESTQALAKTVGKRGVILVVGSPNSSNTLRLVEEAKRLGVSAYRVDDPEEINTGVNPEMDKKLAKTKKIGITAGASAPETLVRKLVRVLCVKYGITDAETITTSSEDIKFPQPEVLE